MDVATARDDLSRGRALTQFAKLALTLRTLGSYSRWRRVRLTATHPYAAT
jgi:hypothetical protein